MTQLTYAQTRAVEDLQMRTGDLAKAILHHVPASEHRTTLRRTLDTLSAGLCAAVLKGVE